MYSVIHEQKNYNLSMGRSREFDTDVALDAAIETFWRHGFEATPMQDLCRSMDLGPGSIYAAFGDKRGLFHKALRRYMKTVSTQAVERINGASSGLEGIRGYFEHLVNTMVDGKRQWGCLMTNSVVEFASRDPELAVLFQLHLARLETAFSAALSRARFAGELRPEVGPEAAVLLVAVVQGMNVMAKTRPGRTALEGIVESVIIGLALQQL